MAVSRFTGTSTDLGVLRSLQSCADEDGFFTVLALDHPAAWVLGGASGGAPSDDEVRAAREVKRQMVARLAPHSSAVLLDPEAGLPAAIATGALPGSVGLMLGAETEAYQVVADAHVPTQERPGWSAAQARRAGADGFKLLWRYRHDVPEAAAHRDLVRRVADECAAVSLPLVVEPIWVALPGEDLADPAVREARVRGVVDYAELAQRLGADRVKTEFPGWVTTPESTDRATRACAEIDARLTVPWLVLSAGVGFDEFLVQTQIAAQAGCSGFIAGRAVWDVAAGADPAARAAGLEVAADRLDRLTAAVHADGTPWRAAADAAAVDATYDRHWYLGWAERPSGPQPADGSVEPPSGSQDSWR
jgi:tagatose 1,6-diphosphate aldolase